MDIITKSYKLIQSQKKYTTLLKSQKMHRYSATANPINLFGFPWLHHCPLRLSFSNNKQLMRKTAENTGRLSTINQHLLACRIQHIIRCHLCNKDSHLYRQYFHFINVSIEILMINNLRSHKQQLHLFQIQKSQTSMNNIYQVAELCNLPPCASCYTVLFSAITFSSWWKQNLNISKMIWMGLVWVKPCKFNCLLVQFINNNGSSPPSSQTLDSYRPKDKMAQKNKQTVKQNTSLARKQITHGSHDVKI